MILYLVIISFLLLLMKSNINKNSICIFGLAVNIPNISIEIFIRSLKETKYKGTLILFLQNNTTIKYFKQLYKYKIIILEREWPFYSYSNINYYLNKDFLTNCMIPNNKYKFKWNIFRYSIIYCWLMKYSNEYDFYFLLDVRDSLFQKNLEFHKYNDGVYLSEDARFPFKIKDDKYNRNWINVYKKNSSIQYCTPLNSGTVYGSQKEFTSFIQLYVEFIKSKYINTAEQGTLNYLYYSGYFKNITFIINKNDEDIIYNMGIEVIYKKYYRSKTYTVNDSIVYRYPKLNAPIIVHQYDRDKILLKLIKQKYG